MKPYQLGIIPCTSLKNREGRTARTLYRGGPFSLMMRHAALYCDHVLIMSAKYGLLELDDPVEWYDAYLPNLDQGARDALGAELMMRLLFIAPAEPRRVLSYLPRAYHDFLLATAPGVVELWNYNRPFGHLGSMKMFARLSQEIKLANARLLMTGEHPRYRAHI